MIYIKNTQRGVLVNIEQLRADVECLLQYLGFADYDLSVWVTTDQTIRRFNKQFRNKDTATDILSFGGLAFVDQDDPNLGDLVISAPFVVRMLPELGCSFDARMRVLLVHGITHLLGYDHETEEEWREMQQKEKELLGVLS